MATRLALAFRHKAGFCKSPPKAPISLSSTKPTELRAMATASPAASGLPSSAAVAASTAAFAVSAVALPAAVAPASIESAATWTSRATCTEPCAQLCQLWYTTRSQTLLLRSDQPTRFL